VRTCAIGSCGISALLGPFLPEVTASNITWPRRGSLGSVHACVTGSCAISALVGPFHRKWRSSNVTRGASPGTGSHVIGSALGVLSRTSASMIVYELTLSLVICPFPAILCSWGAPSIITFLTKVCCFRICCVVLQAVQGVSAFSLWNF
jgi:hypothetical protein